MRLRVGEAHWSRSNEKCSYPLTVSLIVGFGGSLAHAASLANGDFSAGNSGFFTDYTTLAVPGTHTNPPSYNTVKNPGTAFTNGYNSYTDHTGDAAALMLFVDGASGTRFWYEPLNLAASTTYTFSFWATGADNENQADIQATLNGTALDAGNTLTTVGQWVQYTDTFTTTGAGPYTLALSDLNNIQLGNDFTVDDIALTGGATPLPAALPLFATGLGALGLFGWRRKRKNAAAMAAA
jgi:hypothetical protein